MSEILTFNLPISISRERWDAIIREAARKVYTEGLVDPGEALMPEVAKAATAALRSPPNIVSGDGQQALMLPAPVEPANPAMIRAQVDEQLLKLVNLINSGKWTLYDGSHEKLSLKQPVAVLSVDIDGVLYRICHMLPSHKNILFLSHRQKPVREILGYGADKILRRWMNLGILIKRRTGAQDGYSRFSHNISLLGQGVSASKIDISMLSDLNISVGYFRFLSP